MRERSWTTTKNGKAVYNTLLYGFSLRQLGFSFDARRVNESDCLSYIVAFWLGCFGFEFTREYCKTIPTSKLGQHL